MDKVREQLIEILNDVQRHGAGYTEHERYGIRLDDEVWNEEVADYLISKGVTIERWIPVSEMLPEDMPENNGKKVINCIVAHPPYKKIPGLRHPAEEKKHPDPAGYRLRPQYSDCPERT